MIEPLQPGDPRLLGRFIVLARLGKGGMGLVYLGQAGNGSLVAIKVIRRELAGDPAAMRRFRREVLAASRVPRHCTAPVVTTTLTTTPPTSVPSTSAGRRWKKRSPTIRCRGPSCTAWPSPWRTP